MEKIKVISLFSGAGGLDLGFRGDFDIFNKKYNALGFEIIDACEIESKAVETYNYNFKTEHIARDIKDYKNIQQTDVVLGGFPCQDFSLAGKLKGLLSERGNLYSEMIRVVESSKAKVFLAENVENLVKMDDGKIIEKIIADFKEIGYHLTYKVFDMSEYGIPQSRKRVFILGIRNDLYNQNIKILDLEKYKVKEKMTSYDAIDDLWGKVDINMQDKYSKAKFRENKNLQGNKRIDKNSPAPTIRAEHHGNIEGHYRTLGEDENTSDITKWRRLTPRECARIQTFPDEFYFPVSASAAYKQIGNAVPPVFAWYIANNIRGILREIK